MPIHDVVAEGEPRPTCATDIFSLGILLLQVSARYRHDKAGRCLTNFYFAHLALPRI